MIVISIDGLRPDAIDAAGAETLKRADRAGRVLPDGADDPAVDHAAQPHVDAHGAGLPPPTASPGTPTALGYIIHPTVFSVALQAGKKSAMIFAKEKFHFLANPNCVSWIYGPPTPAKVPVSEDDCEVEELKRSLQAEPEAWKATTTAEHDRAAPSRPRGPSSSGR